MSSNTPATVSFEFFPVSSAKGAEGLLATVARLAALRPGFVSVTCPAGGLTRERTREAVHRIREEAAIAVAPHVLCVGATRVELDQAIEDYVEKGVRDFVALRGDPGAGADRFVPHPGGYESSIELIASIARRGRFDINVAAYPEVHPEARSAGADMDYLKRKIDAGGTRAITQFFFDADVYAQFLDRARAAGIEAPIVPGILPVWDLARVRAFAERCGARIPESVEKRFAGLENRPDERRQAAVAFGAELCARLREAGTQHFHFYTMNRSDLVLDIWATLAS